VDNDSAPQLYVSCPTWLLLWLFYPHFFMEYFGNLVAILTILVLTPLVHRAVNIAAYKMGKKPVPW